jgi:glucose-6-phosphate isomerase, archaeal
MSLGVNFDDLRKGCDRKIVRRFFDMKDRFANSNGTKWNPLIYVVYIKDFGTFETGVTVMEAGDVNGEFYMTKGHRHFEKLKEIYVLLEGKAKLLLVGKRSRVIDMKKGKSYIISGKLGHRLVNVGRGRVKVLTIYSKDAGHDYNFKFRKRFFKNGFSKKKR